MKKITIFFLGAAAVFLLINFSCKKENGSGNTSGNNTNDQDSILLNIGNNIISPGYQSLANAVNVLDQSIADFNAGPDAAKLSSVQNNFKSAYVAWQSVSEYNYFGPASTLQPLLTSLNIFPASISVINSNIDANDNNINTFANTVAKGFPALDYLLFGADNITILNYFTTDAKAANRKQYLAAVSADIKADIDAVVDAWSAGGGNYVNQFVMGKGNSVSSSLGLLINSINQDFEILKNNRLGVPLGKIPVGVVSPVLPDEVEAFYSGISAQLALAQLKTIQGIFLGTAAKGNGLGLSAYLVNANAKYHGGLLSDTIKVAFEKAVSDLQAVADPLSQSIQTNPTPASLAFTDCQRLVTLLKTDMPSALGILITYGDNDGD